MWQVRNGRLYREFKFKDFDQAFTFMQTVAEVAVSMDHHPKWTNDYNRVEIWLSTHQPKRQITNKDYKLAEAIDIIFSQASKASRPKAKLLEAKLYIDGASRGNPGQSAYAYLIYRMDGTVVEKSGAYLGLATNNQAEYQGLKRALQRARELGVKKVSIFMDSELVVKQIKGDYKVKNQALKPIYDEILKILDAFELANMVYVPRGRNKMADAEVNRILDEQKNRS